MDSLKIKRSDGTEREIAVPDNVASLGMDDLKILPVLAVQSLQTVALVEIANALWAIHKRMDGCFEIMLDPQIADSLGKMEETFHRLADK